MNRIDGKQTEFEWKIFPGFTTTGILEEIQKFLKSIQCEPEHFTDRIIFMFMFDEIMCGENDNTAECHESVGRFHRGQWSFQGSTRFVLINQTESGTKLQQ